jgi:acyl-CoA synthetase (AMP-forming)/AMP-acid ligase II/thioesterase domain-containing protein
MPDTLLDQLRMRAGESPSSPALLAPGSPVLTHAGLQVRIQQVAAGSTAAGMRRGDVVIVIEPDAVELLCLFLGIASIGACAPLNPALSRSELEFHMADLRAKALITSDLDSAAVSVARVLNLTILETRAIFHCERKRKSLPAAPGPDEHALLLHTSATTGHAKLVPIAHRQLHAMAGNSARLLQLTARDRFLSMMPLFHLQGLNSAAAQLAAGGSVVCTPGFDAKRFPGWLEEFQPTWYTAGPALHAAILPVARAAQARIRSTPLRFVRSIGARLTPQLLHDTEETVGVPVLEGYGLTETGTVTSNPLPPGLRKSGSAGPVNGCDLAILDESCAPLPSGRRGQIAVRGPAVFTGYLRNEAANNSAFHDGWFLTGDLGWLDDDRYLHISGRLKEMINRGGEKVLPGEIDDVLLSHPAVAKAAAFALPHPTLGEDVAAAVVLRPGMDLREPDLRRFAATHLAPFKLPRRIFLTGSIPAGATGKPQRSVLAQQMAARPGSFQPPETELQIQLAGIWQRLLHLDQAGIEDDFFGLGGDSFAVTLLMAELEMEFGAAASGLDESAFFACPTIATLAQMMEGSLPKQRQATPVHRPPFVALQRDGSLLPFFCIPGADENPYYFRELAQSLGQNQPFYIIRDPRPMETRGDYTVEQVAARFIETIRSLQGRGPYLLGGHCFGGIVAYEAARQLAAAGERVGRVVLFEVPVPGYPKVLRHWRRYGIIAGELLRGRRRVSFADLTAHLRLLAGLARKRFRRKLTQLPPPPLTSAPHASPAPREHANVRAHRTYRPKPFNGPVTQFIASDEPHSHEILDNPLWAWQEFVHGVFEVLPAPGPAVAIFRHPHVHTLATRLRRVLADASTT